MGPSLETEAIFDAVLSVNSHMVVVWVSAIAVTRVCDEKRAGVRLDPAPIWQKRFYDFNVRINVRTEQKQIEKLRYIHRNPGSPASPVLACWGGSR